MLSTRPAFGRLALLVFVAALFSGAAAPDAAAQDIRTFINAVEKAIDADDFQGLRSLVDKGDNLSIRTALTFENRALKAHEAGNTDDLERYKKYMNQLAVTYKLAHNKPFLVNRQKWFGKLSEAQLATRGEVQASLNAGFEAKDTAKTSGNEADWRTCIGHFDKMMRGSESIGDYYLGASAASEAAFGFKSISDDFARAYYLVWMARLADKGELSDTADNAKAQMDEMKNYDKVKREDLIDTSLPVEDARKAWETAYKKSLEVSVGEGEGGGGGSLVPPKPMAENEWVEDKGFKETKLNRKKLSLPWTNTRGMANGGVTPFPYWAGPFKIDKGSKDVDLFFFGEKAKASWDGKLKVDYDGEEGKGKAKTVKVKKGKAATLKFTGAYETGAKRKLAVELYDIAYKVKAFGQTFGYTDEGQLLYYVRGASAVKGKIRGHEVTLVDTSGDCRFNDYGEDCIVVGKGKEQRAEPLGRYVYFQQENGWYPYEVKVVSKDGNVVRSRPYSGPLAPLRVNFGTANGSRPDFLVAKGSQEFNDFYIDLNRALDDIVWVPPTTLSIHRGAMTVGSGRNKGSIMIGKGRSRGFKVETGKMNVWDLCDAGEKGCWLDGKVVRDLEKGSDLLAEGKFVRVYGNAGEEYHNFLGGRYSPTVEVRKGSAEGGKIASEEMGVPKGNGFQLGDMFFPKTTRLKRAYRRGVDMVAQFKAKHPVFGEMVSEWVKVDT